MDEGVLQEITAARADVLARIALAAKGAGRDASSVQLVAVSKVQPDERIEAMLAAGQRVFGENRVQEAEGRWQPRRAAPGNARRRGRSASRRWCPQVWRLSTYGRHDDAPR